MVGILNQNRVILTSPLKDDAGTPWATDGDGDGVTRQGTHHCVGRPALALPISMPPAAHQLPPLTTKISGTITEKYVAENITAFIAPVGWARSTAGCKIDYHYDNCGDGSAHTAVNQYSMYPAAGGKLDHALAASISSVGEHYVPYLNVLHSMRSPPTNQPCDEGLLRWHFHVDSPGDLDFTGAVSWSSGNGQAARFSRRNDQTLEGNARAGLGTHDGSSGYHHRKVGRPSRVPQRQRWAPMGLAVAITRGLAPTPPSKCPRKKQEQGVRARGQGQIIATTSAAPIVELSLGQCIGAPDPEASSPASGIVREAYRCPPSTWRDTAWAANVRVVLPAAAAVNTEAGRAFPSRG